MPAGCAGSWCQPRHAGTNGNVPSAWAPAPQAGTARTAQPLGPTPGLTKGSQPALAHACHGAGHGGLTRSWHRAALLSPTTGCREFSRFPYKDHTTTYGLVRTSRFGARKGHSRNVDTASSTYTLHSVGYHSPRCKPGQWPPGSGQLPSTLHNTPPGKSPPGWPVGACLGGGNAGPVGQGTSTCPVLARHMPWQKHCMRRGRGLISPWPMSPIPGLCGTCPQHVTPKCLFLAHDGGRLVPTALGSLPPSDSVLPTEIKLQIAPQTHKCSLREGVRVGCRKKPRKGEEDVLHRIPRTKTHTGHFSLGNPLKQYETRTI